MRVYALCVFCGARNSDPEVVAESIRYGLTHADWAGPPLLLEGDAHVSHDVCPDCCRAEGYDDERPSWTT